VEDHLGDQVGRASSLLLSHPLKGQKQAINVQRCCWRAMRVVLNDLVDLIVNAQAQQGVDVRWVRRLKRTREMR
jgi:hypothetical protein